MSGFAFEKTIFDGAYLIKSFFAGDNRGIFIKLFEKNIYNVEGISFSLNETFLSISAKNVVRGLHFQAHNPQAKLVSVIKGRAWDVIVDLRPDSITYKNWAGYELSSDNHMAIYVPKGFAHGFVSMEDDTIMLYQCDGAYDKESDTGIIYNDPDIAIKWPIEENLAIHSKRDMNLMSFAEYENNYIDL